jgi:hypothetical protein
VVSFREVQLVTLQIPCRYYIYLRDFPITKDNKDIQSQ